LANYLDNFTAANGTRIDSRASDSGHTYSSNTNYKIQTNRAYAEGSGEQLLQVLTAGAANYITASEYDLEFDYYVASNSGQIGIYFGTTDTSNNYYIRVRQGATLDLFSVVAGTFTQIGTTAISSSGASTGAVKAEVRAGSITVFLDAVEVFSTTNTDHSRAGLLYLRTSEPKTSATGFHLDSVSITDVSSGLTIDTAPADIRAETSRTITISGATATPTVGNTTVYFT
jgi:hypothetical protein